MFVPPADSPQVREFHGNHAGSTHPGVASSPVHVVVAPAGRQVGPVTLRLAGEGLQLGHIAAHSVEKTLTSLTD